MAKKEETKEKKTRKHLHSIRTEATDDGHMVHHHTYKGKKEDMHTEPERMNAAVSSSPEEAGQHVADMFAQNQPDAGDEGGGDPAAAAAATPAGGAPAAGE